MAKEGTTRYYSTMQEDKVAELIGGYRVANSGAGLFNKGDVVQKDASLLVECKTPTSEKDSFSIKKEWILKNKEEAHSKRMFNNAVAFTFGPQQANYFIIDESTFIL